MGKFTKENQPKNRGRKKRDRSLPTLKKIIQICSDNNFHPAEKLLELFPKLTIKEQADVCMQLLPYLEAKKKPKEEPDPIPNPESDPFDDTDEAQLLQLVKQ